MKRALFITIGTRDVAISKDVLQQQTDANSVKACIRKVENGREQMLARPLGKLIHENFNKLKKDISLPIIEPFLNYISIDGALHFDVVYLIATDQKEDLVGDFAQGDTLHFAEIIKRLLPSKYKSKNGALTGKIEIIKATESVVFLDSMFAFFANRLNSNKFNFLKEYEEIHVLNQGGIDAINYGLLLNTLYLYGSKTKLYSVNEKLKLCNPVNFGEQFIKEQSKIQFLQALRRYDYAFAKSLGLGNDITLWAGYAEARLNFDFDVAHERLSHLSTEMRDRQIFELGNIAKTRASADSLVCELYWNAMIRYEQEAYVDFVQRFFRIVEQYAQSKALSYMRKLAYDSKSHWKWTALIEDFLNMSENDRLKAHLDDAFVEEGSTTKLDYISKPTIPVFMNILAFYNKKEYDYLNQFVPLSKLRNKGIGAHGFEPISQKQILEKVGVSKPDFDKLLAQLGKKLKAGENPFNRINEILVSLLNK